MIEFIKYILVVQKNLLANSYSRLELTVSQLLLVLFD